MMFSAQSDESVRCVLCGVSSIALVRNDFLFRSFEPCGCRYLLLNLLLRLSAVLWRKWEALVMMAFSSVSTQPPPPGGWALSQQQTQPSSWDHLFLQLTVCHCGGWKCIIGNLLQKNIKYASHVWQICMSTLFPAASAGNRKYCFIPLEYRLTTSTSGVIWRSCRLR